MCVPEIADTYIFVRLHRETSPHIAKIEAVSRLLGQCPQMGPNKISRESTMILYADAIKMLARESDFSLPS